MCFFRALLVLLVTGVCSGCVSLHVTWPVQVTVVDVNSRKPVANVSVETMYTYFLTLNVPRDAHTTTDENGQAIIPVAYLSFPCNLFLIVDGIAEGDQFHVLPLSDFLKPMDFIKPMDFHDGVEYSYSIKYEPSSWFAYWKQQRMANNKHRGTESTVATRRSY